jgi:hypothetical protein
MEMEFIYNFKIMIIIIQIINKLIKDKIVIKIKMGHQKFTWI